MKTADLGDEVICKITDFSGIVTSYSRNITGCDRIYIQPKIDKEGKHRDGVWADVAQVRVVKKAKIKEADVNVEKPGGPMSKIR